MSQLSAQFVKKGFWIDNTRGPVMGRTITTDTQTGNIVVALMAVLATLGTKNLWNLTLFVYHQMRVSNQPSDGFYKQQQAIMRSLTGPVSIASDSLKLWWIWRRRTNRTISRSLPLFALAVIFAAATLVVGVFSSYLVDSTDIIVLVSSPYCRPISYSTKNVTAAQSYGNSIGASTSQYVRDCYTNRISTPERCKIFTRSTLPSRQERIGCPFEQSMCKNISSPGLAFDTGLLDLNEHVGLNLAPKDGMKYRQTAKCAVLELEGHSDITNASNSTTARLKANGGQDFSPNEMVKRIYLGKTGSGNVTFAIRHGPIDSPRTNALIQYYESLRSRGSADKFEPIQELKDNNSDLRITMLYSTLSFMAPVDDPLFSAHRPVRMPKSDNSSVVVYKTDEPVSAFACQYQYQFCFTDAKQKDECSALQGLPSSTASLNISSINDVQLSLLNLLVTLLGNTLSRETPSQDVSPGLVTELLSVPLPKDQWIRQFNLLNDVAVSQLPIGLEAYSLGLSNFGLEGIFPMRQNATAVDQSLCTLQRMQSPGGFVNINVFALAFMSTFCVLVTALDLFLLKFLVYSDKLRGIFAPRIDSWIQDGVLQFQRRAYEAHGEGSWERLDKEVPATTDDVQLATLPTVSKPSCNCSVASSLLAKRASTETFVSSNSPSIPRNTQPEVARTALSVEHDTADELTDLTAMSLNGPPTSFVMKE
ncbi:unnamed protein product [Periconia digitata]|uniref:Transmembrane protein n=1 Tax=Periconia digitata TaxID=1303443 RepID=A0A9W4XG23_9PLEO|nr:unnamed protein product [Periconia digitata]